MVSPSPRVLATAFAAVPGANPDASAIQALASAVRSKLDIITVKTRWLPHSEHYLGGRMFRVPVGSGSAQSQRETFGRAVARQLESERYDLVHVRGAIEGVAAAQQKAADGFSFVYELTSYPDGEVDPAWRVAHEACCAHAEAIVVPTSAAAAALARLGHAKKAKVVSPGVDIHRYDRVDAPYGGSASRILYLGTFHEDRDITAILDAVTILRREFTLTVLLAGDPHPGRRAKTRDKVAERNLEDIVIVQGEPRPETAANVIGAADLCLCTAGPAPRFEKYGDVPQPLLPALACGRPLVAANTPGVSEFTRDGEEALHYVAGDATSLADACRRVLQSNSLRDSLVKAGYERTRSQFSGATRRRQLTELYNALCPGSQEHDPWSNAFDPLDTGSALLPSELDEENANSQRESTDISPGPRRLPKDTIDCSREELGVPGEPSSRSPKDNGSHEGSRRSKRS